MLEVAAPHSGRRPINPGRGDGQSHDHGVPLFLSVLIRPPRPAFFVVGVGPISWLQRARSYSTLFFPGSPLGLLRESASSRAPSTAPPPLPGNSSLRRVSAKKAGSLDSLPGFPLFRKPCGPSPFVQRLSPDLGFVGGSRFVWITPRSYLFPQSVSLSGRIVRFGLFFFSFFCFGS